MVAILLGLETVQTDVNLPAPSLSLLRGLPYGWSISGKMMVAGLDLPMSPLTKSGFYLF